MATQKGKRKKEAPSESTRLMKAIRPQQLGTGQSLRVEVEAGDVIRLMLQFLEDRGLEESAAALRSESGVGRTAVEDVGGLAKAVETGKWDVVLRRLGGTEVPKTFLADVHEAVIFDLLAVQETEVAKAVLRQSEALRLSDDMERRRNLETAVAVGEVRPKAALAKTRADLAKELPRILPQVDSARLETLLGHSLHWLQHTGQLFSSSKVEGSRRIDIFRGCDADHEIAEKTTTEDHVKRSAGVLKFGKECRPTAAVFSAAGDAIITGSTDGFVEIWDLRTCRLKLDLAYQARDELLIHDDGVLSLAQSVDGLKLASSDSAGVVKAWDLREGTCLRKWKLAAAATALAFGIREALAAGLVDGQVQTLGLASGARLATFRGHDASVTALFFERTKTTLVSAAKDGSIKVWDTASQTCLRSVHPADVRWWENSDAGILTVTPFNDNDHLLVPSGGSRLGVVTGLRQTMTTLRVFDGRVQNPAIATLQADKRAPTFVAATVAPPSPVAHRWAYCLSDDARLFVFRVTAASSTKIIQPGKEDDDDDEEPLGPSAVIDVAASSDAAAKKDNDENASKTFASGGIAHHPHRSLVATYGGEDVLRLWKA